MFTPRGIRSDGTRGRILLYHGINSSVVPDISAEEFGEQMKWLASSFSIVCVRELVQCLTDLPGSRPCAAVTFDDGYRDNFEIALPILERYSLKATFFITSGYVGTTFPTSHGVVPMMSHYMIKEIARLGHEIGAHTVAHPILSEVDDEVAFSELSVSRRQLEDIAAQPVTSVAYPHGRWDPRIVRLAKMAGFKAGVTTEPSFVTKDGDCFTMPRVWISPHYDLHCFSSVVMCPTPFVIQWARWRCLTISRMRQYMLGDLKARP